MDNESATKWDKPTPTVEGAEQPKQTKEVEMPKTKKGSKK